MVGEAEVQGQVRRAYEAALEAGTTGPLTNRLFTAALQTGKRVRTETGIARERVTPSGGKARTAFKLTGEGPHVVNVQLVTDPGRTASIPIVGSRAADRDRRAGRRRCRW